MNPLPYRVLFRQQGLPPQVSMSCGRLFRSWSCWSSVPSSAWLDSSTSAPASPAELKQAAACEKFLPALIWAQAVYHSPLQQGRFMSSSPDW